MGETCSNKQERASLEVIKGAIKYILGGKKQKLELYIFILII